MATFKINEAIIPEKFSIGIKAFSVTAAKNHDIYKKTLDELLETGYLLRNELDENARAIFVGLQSIFERYFTYLVITGVITDVWGFIHTPLPATPFCKHPDNIVDDSLVSKEVKNDPNRLKTVIDRAHFLRIFITNGGTMVTLYGKNGLQQRTQSEREIYLNEIEKNKANLIDTPLDIEEYPKEYIGGIYFFKYENQNYSFSLKSYQAVDTEGKRDWGIWLGKTDNQVMRARINDIGNFLKQHCSNQEILKKFEC